MKKILIGFLVVFVLIFIFGISIYGKHKNKYLFEKVVIRKIAPSSIDSNQLKINCIESDSILIGITFYKKYCSDKSTKSQFKLSAIEPGISGIVNIGQVDSLRDFFKEVFPTKFMWVNRNDNPVESEDSCLTMQDLFRLIQNNKRAFRGIRYDGDELIFSGNNYLQNEKLKFTSPSFLIFKTEPELSTPKRN